MRAARQDANSTQLDEAARALGAFVLTMPPEVGFDRLVAFRGRLHAIEYKDGAKPPSRRKLTANEANVAAQMGTRGVPVRVVCSTGEIIAVLMEG